MMRQFAPDQMKKEFVEGSRATWKLQWKVVASADILFGVLYLVFVQLSGGVQLHLTNDVAGRLLTAARSYESLISNQLSLLIGAADVATHVALASPVILMLQRPIAAASRMIGSSPGDNLSRQTLGDTTRLVKQKSSLAWTDFTRGLKMSDAVGNAPLAMPSMVKASISKQWLVLWPLVCAKLYIYFYGPVFEELLYRGILQGGLIRTFGGNKRGTAAVDKAASPLSAAQKARRRRLIQFFVAAAFSWMHACNHIPLLASGSATDRWTGAFSALLQMYITFMASFFVYSPVYEQHGIVGAAGAHVTWNLFTLGGGIRLLAFGRLALLIGAQVRSRLLPASFHEARQFLTFLQISECAKAAASAVPPPALVPVRVQEPGSQADHQ